MAKKRKDKKKFNMPGGRHSKKSLSKKLTYRYKALIKRMKSKEDKTVKHEKYSSTFKFNKFYCVHSDGLRMTFKKTSHKYSKCNREGYCIINLELLGMHVLEITTHCMRCPLAHAKLNSNDLPIKLIGETHRMGLASIISAVCLGCEKTFNFDTSKKIKSSNNNQRYEINLRAVWGQMATGGGASNLNEQLGTIGVPGLRPNTFTAIEREISTWWKNILMNDMREAAEEEKQIALQKGHKHEDVPYITVICDGGWSKRSHKHSYNALGGVAIIVGAETGKVLHMGVRNKFCKTCTLAQTFNRKANEHECFYNWKESSQAMEADIILEGFLECESKYGLRYLNIIADGDSSVMANLIDKGPHWCKYIKKVQCANHALKCFRSNLEKLIQNNPSYKGRNNLSKQQRIRLVTAVRCAIRMRSKESNRASAILKLKKDIKNSINHVLGIHTNCSQDFCKVQQEKYSNPNNTKVSSNTDSVPTSSDVDSSSSSDSVQSIIDIINNQQDLWGEDDNDSGDDIDLNEQCTDLNNNLLIDISVLLNRLCNIADQLICNFTTNLAESWMSIRMKLDGGKVINRNLGGSWEARCVGGGIRKNFGADWSPKVWQLVTHTSPLPAFNAVYFNIKKQRDRNSLFNKQIQNRQRAIKRKRERNIESKSKKAKLSYGNKSLQAEPDCSPEQIKEGKKLFIEKNVKVNKEQIKLIEQKTRSQSSNNLWRKERRIRLTASNAGRIVKKRPKTKFLKIIEDLLYSNFKGNKYTIQGLSQERFAIQEYLSKKNKKNKNVSVSSSGLHIHPTLNFLAASPDGIVTDNKEEGLLEIKHVLLNKNIDLVTAAQSSSFCLQKKNKLSLKVTHNFYFQIQAQLAICNKNWCDLIVRCTNPYGIHIERITRDKHLWENDMLPKLKWFYYEALLPELAMPRHGKFPGIREPSLDMVCILQWSITFVLVQPYVK